MIKLNGVTKTYVMKKRKKTALNNVSLDLPSSGFYTVIGKSGSGKSTLLNILGCLDKPTLGEMSIDNKEVSTLSMKELDYYRNTMIGFVFQSFNLIDEYTIYDNIALALELQNYSNEEIDSKVSDILNKFDLSSIDYKYPNQISGGEKQRAAIARALVKQPKILLVDEPTGNLDKENANIVLKLLKEISKDILIVMVTHDEKSVKKYSDGVIKLENGKVIENSIINNNEETEDVNLLKKSKFNLKRIFKFSFSNIKHRKLKFINMILLLTITFSFLFVTFHLFNYDKGYSSYKNFVDNDITSISLVKSSDYCEGSGITRVCWSETYSATTEDVNSLRERYENIDFNYLKSVNIYISNEDDFDDRQPYYNNTIKGIVYVRDMSIMEDKLKYGKVPENKNEVIISEYLAEMIIKFVYKEIDSAEFLVNNYLPIKGLGTKNKIVGIFEDNHKQYTKLKEYEKSGYFAQLLTNFEVARNNDYALIYTTEDFMFSEILDSFTSNEMNLKYNTKVRDFNILSTTYTNDAIPLLGNSATITNKNDVILDVATFADIFKLSKQDIYDNNTLVNSHLGTSIWLEYNYDALNKKSKTISLNVVGVANHESGVYVSNQYFDELYEDIIASNAWMYSGVHMELDTNNQEQSVQLLNDLESLGFKHNTAYSDALYVSATVFDSLKTAFIVIIVILLIFSCLLVISTIKSTIVDRIHDIGILKSLGTTNIDICKIFLIESGLVSIVVTILSISFGLLTNSMVNTIIGNSFDAPITVIYFSIGALIGIILITIALINSFCLFALRSIFTTKPIETINK